MPTESSREMSPLQQESIGAPLITCVGLTSGGHQGLNNSKFEMRKSYENFALRMSYPLL